MLNCLAKYLRLPWHSHEEEKKFLPPWDEPKIDIGKSRVGPAALESLRSSPSVLKSLFGNRRGGSWKDTKKSGVWDAGKQGILYTPFLPSPPPSPSLSKTRPVNCVCEVEENRAGRLPSPPSSSPFAPRRSLQNSRWVTNRGVVNKLLWSPIQTRVGRKG